MRWAANQCEYGPISVKVLVYTETSKPCSFAAKGRAREFVGFPSTTHSFRFAFPRIAKCLRRGCRRACPRWKHMTPLA